MIIFAIVAFVALMGFAVGQGRTDVIITVGGYALAALLITVLIVTGCVFGYTKFVHYLWTLSL